MARTKRPSENDPPTLLVRVDKTIAAKAKAIAIDRGIDLPEYLSELLLPLVERDWAKMIKRIDQGGGDPPKR